MLNNFSLYLTNLKFHFWLNQNNLGVQKKHDNSAYRIEEIPTVYGTEPNFPSDAGGWKWIKNNSVWNDAPISVSGSGKSCLYWEKKWYDKNNNSNPVLKDGIIRVIGRYWEEGKEDDYRVTLKAQCDNKTIERDLKVGKPGKLGNSYNDSRDVFHNPISIDNICIETGGKNGIPPQVIKGQMQKETDFKNAYRYEPFIDISYQSNDEIKKELFDSYDYFTVTSINMGTVNIPSNHINVSPNFYPNQPKKISDFFVENIWKYIQRPNNDNGNLPKVVGSETKKTGNLTETLREIYEENISNKEKNPLNKAVDSLKKYVESDSFKVRNMYAQTRIIASYGMLQQTFYDAHYKKLAGFSVSNSIQQPELLNEKNYSMKSYSERIGRQTKKRTGNNWSDGYENGWEKILKNYNPGEKGYEKDILENSKSFLPVK